MRTHGSWQSNERENGNSHRSHGNLGTFKDDESRWQLTIKEDRGFNSRWIRARGCCHSKESERCTPVNWLSFLYMYPSSIFFLLVKQKTSCIGQTSISCLLTSFVLLLNAGSVRYVTFAAAKLNASIMRWYVWTGRSFMSFGPKLNPVQGDKDWAVLFSLHNRRDNCWNRLCYNFSPFL